MSEVIRIEIPEWAKERHIYVFAGSEPLAIKLHGRKLVVKKVRCNWCGKCCIEVGADWIFGEKEMFIDGKVEKVCGKLVKEGPNKYACSAGCYSPWCCIYKCPVNLPHPDCVIRYE
ncbi:MAG: hypothetical protein ACE5I5_19920 [Candidatus Heimdallarchaeota archaeon]